MAQAIPQDIDKMRHLWETQVDMRPVILKRCILQRRVEALRAMGTPRWPMELPVDLFQMESSAPLSIKEKKAFWRYIIRRDDVALVHHLRVLAPEEWQRCLYGVWNGRIDMQEKEGQAWKPQTEKGLAAFLKNLELSGEHACAYILEEKAPHLLHEMWQQQWHQQVGLKAGWPLVRAAPDGWVTGAHYLLEHQCPPDERASEIFKERTALMLATRYHHTEMITLLLQQGANPLLRDSDKKMALTIVLEDCVGTSTASVFGTLDSAASTIVLLLSVTDPRLPMYGPRSRTILDWSARLDPRLYGLVQEAAARYEAHEALQDVLDTSGTPTALRDGPSFRKRL